MQRKVYQLVDRFQSDRTSVDHWGCLTTSGMAMLNELMVWFKRAEGLLSLI